MLTFTLIYVNVKLVEDPNGSEKNIVDCYDCMFIDWMCFLTFEQQCHQYTKGKNVNYANVLQTYKLWSQVERTQKEYAQ